ncbi:uncharacterized protein [Palaemon carinicauda]|uniref:uncharacterized protein n=1 Tax=Palaemon carinicauda TaxID=392227 RepID=UPI0035B60225
MSTGPSKLLLPSIVASMNAPPSSYMHERIPPHHDDGDSLQVQETDSERRISPTSDIEQSGRRCRRGPRHRHSKGQSAKNSLSPLYGKGTDLGPIIRGKQQLPHKLPENESGATSITPICKDSDRSLHGIDNSTFSIMLSPRLKLNTFLVFTLLIISIIFCNESYIFGSNMNDIKFGRLKQETYIYTNSSSTQVHPSTHLPSLDATRTITIQLKPCSCKRTINTTWTDFGDRFRHASSNCGSWASARGEGQKVVSYSIYGKFPNDYYYGLEQNLKAVRQHYPGWTMRVYHNEKLWSSSEQHEWACNLACENSHLDFCDISNLPDLDDVNTTWGSLWRFIVVGDPTVDRYIVRDCDSPILQREVDAVNEWISSGKCYHVMRDNPHHNVEMMAGMWGGCNYKYSNYYTKAANIRKNMLEYGKYLNQDQPALWLYMWPEVQHDGIFHDAFTCMRYPGSRPFPTKRNGDTYVGMRTYRKTYELDGIRRTCPEICRPINHQEWEFC